MPIKIITEVSARHVHLCKKDLEKLFGKGYNLTPIRDLSQPGDFAAQETLTIKTAKSRIDNVRIIGPLRKKTQVEIAVTDAYTLGIVPPIRVSGDLKGSTGATLIGPKGKVDLKEGVIIAKRHIHASPKDARKYNLKNGQTVSVKIKEGKRRLIFNDVIVRVSPRYLWRFQIDTDEANAAGVVRMTEGEVIKK